MAEERVRVSSSAPFTTPTKETFKKRRLSSSLLIPLYFYCNFLQTIPLDFPLKKFTTS